MDLTLQYNGETIHMTIQNQGIIDEYNRNETKDEFINQLLDVGYEVNKYITPMVSSCGCSHKIDKLAVLLEPFNTGGNSAKNGQIGEIFASSLFTKRNPDITYLDTAAIDKSGDAILVINNHLVDRIMIDYKNYDSCVPSEETKKLVRDLHTQNINYGILVSYKSRISKRKNIDYDIIDGKLIVFVAGTSMDILTLEMAVQYLQRLQECNIVSISDKVYEVVVRRSMEEVSIIYEKIFKISYQHSQNINMVKENQDKINKMFYSIIMNAEKTLTELNILQESINDIIKTTHVESLSNVHSYIDLNEYIDIRVDKEKDKLLAKRLLNMVKELTMTGFYSETDNCIHFGTIGKLSLSKSKVVMIFKNKSDEECTFNPKYESIKNDIYIHIILSDDSEKWNIINRRFTQ